MENLNTAELPDARFLLPAGLILLVILFLYLRGAKKYSSYIKALDNPAAPIKSLKGFKRVNIPAGQTAQVKITLEPKAFEYYDEKIDELSAMTGRYQILYGPSSLDKDLKAIDFTVR